MGRARQAHAISTVDRLKKRADFLRAARGIRRVEGAITLETCATPETLRPARLRVGFTASSKIGNAVTRNRAKRRLRAAASQLLPLLGRAGHDYVLVARGTTVTRPFPALLSDITTALKAAHRKLDAKAGDELNAMRAICRRPLLVRADPRLSRCHVAADAAMSAASRPAARPMRWRRLHKHGPVKGLWLTARRLSRCHPITWLGGSSGFDPVPHSQSTSKTRHP